MIILLSLSSHLIVYSARLGCQTFAVTDASTSTFRIFGLSAPAIKALVNLNPTKPSLGNFDSEGDIGQTRSDLGNKDSSSILNPAANKYKEKQAKVPRPPNAFILYRQEHHPIIKAENPEFHNNDICKSYLDLKPSPVADQATARALGRQWKAESPSVREKYKLKALERKAEHLKRHPHYQYAPRKPGEKKRRASRKPAPVVADMEETLPFIDQEGDYYMASESCSGIEEDDMDFIGTKFDDRIRRFHIDGDGNIGVVLPASSNASLGEMVEAREKVAKQEGEPITFAPDRGVQITTSIPPHVQNDTDFFETLIDWDAIAEDFKVVQGASGEDLAGLAEIETGNPYLSLSDEDQRQLFEAELERTLRFFD
jgi:hypothetical protein